MQALTMRPSAFLRVLQRSYARLPRNHMRQWKCRTFVIVSYIIESGIALLAATALLAPACEASMPPHPPHWEPPPTSEIHNTAPVPAVFSAAMSAAGVGFRPLPVRYSDF
jgi:hypothetical protein